MEILPREQRIIAVILEKGHLQSSQIHMEMLHRGNPESLLTIKRALSHMVVRGLLIVHGSGRSTSYDVDVAGRVFADISANEYCAVEPDRRFGLRRYNFELFEKMPVDIFSTAEIQILDSATAEYTQRTTDLPVAIAKRELERLIIEFSWKSSKIEGNTYSLLDTEKLIMENKEAKGHDPAEAQMILNHKEAFLFVREQAQLFRSPSRGLVEHVHSILVKDLGVGVGLRGKPVGVVGSVYQPLDNVHQIREGMDAIFEMVSRMKTPYTKALTALLGLSYLQPFEDGNKRTTRLFGNGILLGFGCAPLSYRSVDEGDYREAVLVFYEINSVVPFKKIFVNQYDFAARNYAVKL